MLRATVVLAVSLIILGPLYARSEQKVSARVSKEGEYILDFRSPHFGMFQTENYIVAVVGKDLSVYEIGSGRVLFSRTFSSLVEAPNYLVVAQEAAERLLVCSHQMVCTLNTRKWTIEQTLLLGKNEPLWAVSLTGSMLVIRTGNRLRVLSYLSFVELSSTELSGDFCQKIIAKGKYIYLLRWSNRLFFGRKRYIEKRSIVSCEVLWRADVYPRYLDYFGIHSMFLCSDSIIIVSQGKEILALSCSDGKKIAAKELENAVSQDDSRFFAGESSLTLIHQTEEGFAYREYDPSLSELSKYNYHDVEKKATHSFFYLSLEDSSAVCALSRSSSIAYLFSKQEGNVLCKRIESPLTGEPLNRGPLCNHIFGLRLDHVFRPYDTLVTHEPVNDTSSRFTVYKLLPQVANDRPKKSAKNEL